MWKGGELNESEKTRIRDECTKLQEDLLQWAKVNP